MIDPASIESQEEVEDGLDAILAGVSLAVLAIITDRAKEITPETTLAEIMAKYPEDMAKAQEVLAAGKVTVDEYTAQAFTAMARGNDQWAKKYYKAKGVTQTPILAGELKSTVEAGVASSEQITAYMMNTSVIGIEARGAFNTYQTAYKRTIADAVSAMKAGEQTYQQAIETACKTFSHGGLKVVYPDTYIKNITVRGKVTAREVATRSKPLVRELNGALRMNIMDNYRQTMSALRWEQAQEFGADGVEIDAHGLCAPDHLPFQGKQYSLKDYDKIQSVLPRPFEEMNCKHIVSPIILGISEPALSKSDLEDMRKSSTEKVSITGLSGEELTMTRYEATQYQRGIERKLRSVNEQLYMNPSDTAAKAAKKGYSAAYKRVSKDAGLTTRPERTRAYIAS